MRRLLMRVLGALSATALVVVLTACGSVPADDATSGISVGGSIGSYSATKCGGIEDGVDAGKSLCYT
jgi:hypothetical protein